MSQSSTTSVNSLRDLSDQQRKFLSSEGPDPKNRGEVEKFCRAFRKKFGANVPWKTMRYCLTQLQRKKRRNGTGDTTPRKIQPYARVSFSVASSARPSLSL